MDAKGKSKAQLILKIYGRVQGVFFRTEAANQAKALGLTGWVRNKEDGTVELVAEGEREILSQLHQWCRKGPPPSKVETVKVRWKPYTGLFSGFEIRY